MQKKLKLTVKGQLNTLGNRLFNFYYLKKHNVTLHSMSYISSGAEFVLEGDHKSLWSMVNYHKKGSLFCNVTELTFQFV